MGNRDKILVLDGSSYIGSYLFSELGPERARATYFRSPVQNAAYFDSLSMELSQVFADPEEFSHAVVLLAIPNPDLCAADIAKSHALNVESVTRIIDWLNRWEIKPVFTSTESVFDGVKGNYVESDPTSPVLTYGRQKVEVEEYLQRHCTNYVIVRLAKVVGDRRGDGTLFTSWLDAVERSETILCATDQVFSPVHVQDVVNGLIRLIDEDHDGIFHLSNPNGLSRLKLLNVLLAELAQHGPVSADVVPCSINDFDLLEKRPLDVSMNPSKLIAATGFAVRDVKTLVHDIVSNTLSPAPAGER